MRVEVVIDELVLHGVDGRDRHRVADAIAAELSARGTAATITALGRRDAPPTPIGRVPAAGSVDAIATSVVDGILSAIARRES